MNTNNTFETLIKELSDKASTAGLSSALAAVEEVDRLLNERASDQHSNLSVPYVTAEAVSESPLETAESVERAS